MYRFGSKKILFNLLFIKENTLIQHYEKGTDLGVNRFCLRNPRIPYFYDSSNCLYLKEKVASLLFKRGQIWEYENIPLCTDLGVRPNPFNMLFLNNKVLKPSHLWGTDLGVKTTSIVYGFGSKKGQIWELAACDGA